MRHKEVDGNFPGKKSILSDGPEVEAGLGAVAVRRPQWPEWRDVLEDGRKGWVIKCSRIG